MRIEHVAIWTASLEALKAFYETYFGARASEKYVNRAKAFESCFLTFGSGARIELMRVPEIVEQAGGVTSGYAHLAIATGSKERVDALTLRLREAGHPVIDGPRQTGDGYYESTVLDPDGNRIEITV